MAEVEVTLSDGSTTWISDTDPRLVSFSQQVETSSQDGGFGSGFWEGLSNMPADLLSSLGGIKPLVQTAYNVLAGDREEGLRGVADIAGGIAGAGYGATAGGALGALGGPFAPVTVPLGATIGGYLGGSLGSVGTDYAVQALRGQQPPTMEDLGYSMGGGLPYAVGGQALAVANKSMQKLTGSNLADKFERKAIGARSTDFAKSVKQKGTSDLGEIALEEAIKRVGETGVYKENIGDPMALKLALEQQMEGLGSRINPEVARLEKLRQEMGVSNPTDIEVLNAMPDYNPNQISIDPNIPNPYSSLDPNQVFTGRPTQQAQAVIPDVLPDWGNTKRLIEKYRGSGATDAITQKMNERIAQIGQEVDLNTLTGLNKAREALNAQVYGITDPTYVNELSDTLRSDVRAAQMKAVQNVDPNSPLQNILRDYGDRAEIVQKILNRNIAQDSVNVPQPRNWWRTTGGFGVPLALGASGNPYLAAGAVGLSALLETPTGQLMLADILRNNKLSGAPGLAQQGFVPTQQANILMREDQ